VPENLDALQQLILGDARKAYSEKVLEHAMNPRNLGEMKGADGFARVTGTCGDTMEIWIKVNADTIVSSSFMTDGCGTTIAAGSMVTEMAKGRSVSDAMKINQQAVLIALGGLADENEHCALLAANTLNAAIRDCIAMRRDPWKKAYRRGR